jgi:hypothetical protein
VNIAEITAAERETKRTEMAKTPLNIIDPRDSEDCCAKPFRKAERAGGLKTDMWTCPKCGLPWKAAMQDGMRYWTAQAAPPVILR